MRKFIYPFLCSTLLSFTLPLAHAQNNPPVAVDDTATTFSGIEITINVRSNDSDPDGDLFLIDTVVDVLINGTFTYNPFIGIYYTPDLNFVGVDTITYVLCDNGTPSLCNSAIVTINVLDEMYAPYQFLDINNISAMFHAGGALFWDLVGYPAFEVPKGSGLSTIFNAGLWIGGIDINDQLHLAAEVYRTAGPDYSAGPIMDSVNYSITQDSIWNHLWKVNKCDIDSYVANWDQPGYVMPLVFLEWPAHGDISLGQAYNLAPFFDRTGDGYYDPYDGDYPFIKGDQALYFIYNDDRSVHLETGGEKLRIEIHGMAYAFNCPADSALWNTIFLNYKIINRSANTYDSTYAGFNFDPDIGMYADDNIACDVQRGSVYGYNGNPVDGPSLYSYGENPPAQSVTFLKGPLMDADGLDNPKGGCDASINGIGFGDGITDNERWGMNRFIYYNNCVGPKCDPSNGTEFYRYLSGFWKDGTRMLYGGDGHISGCPGNSGIPFSCVEADFMFPDDTDSCGWGTAGVPQAEVWNEQTAQAGGNPPGDRRGVGSMGPFTFSPGDTAEIELAFVFGRDYVDTINPHLASVTVMKERIDSIRAYFENGLFPCGGSPCSFSFTGISESQQEIGNIIIYPNPAKENLTVVFPLQSKDARYTVYDIMGREIINDRDAINRVSASKHVISLTHLNEGMYVLRIKDVEQVYYKKFVKM